MLFQRWDSWNRNCEVPRGGLSSAGHLINTHVIMKLATVVFYCFFFTFVSVACFAMWMIDHWMAKHTLGGILPQNVPVSHCE